jgi:DNA-binding transcriptional ArsR family regulator
VNANAQELLEVLAEPTRREILERLVERPRPVTEIAREMPISRSAVSQHLQVLKRARLVSDHPRGTQRIYTVDPEALSILRAYFDSFWTRSLAAFTDFAESDPDPREESP